MNERIRKEQLGELRQLVQVASRAISNQEKDVMVKVVVNLINQRNA